jgi:hypothetical protein
MFQEIINFVDEWLIKVYYSFISSMIRWMILINYSILYIYHVRCVERVSISIPIRSSESFKKVLGVFP